MKSYIKTQDNILAFFKEYLLLYKSLKKRSDTAAKDAERIIKEYDELTSHIGRDLSKCDVLEVGVGQVPLRLGYLTHKSRSAVGIDLDVIAIKYNLTEFLHMVKCNGMTRTLRTFGRQWLGLNKNLIQAFCAHIGISKFPRLNVIQGDVCKPMPFEPSSFDVIISTNVFEHLADPERAVIEIARLLRPNGVVLVSTSHWGQFNAKHDLEVMYGLKPGRWAHLRPSLAHEVQQHAFVNELRMHDFETLFAQYFDHTIVSGVYEKNLDTLKKELEIARSNGELQDFSDEELLSDTCLIRSIGR